MDRVPNFFRQLECFALVSVLLACAGCWEEVHYDPSSAPPLSQPKPQEKEVVTPTGESPDDSLAAGDPVADDPPIAQTAEPEPTKIDQPASQPDDPLAQALDSESEPSAQPESPAPPTELDWLDAPASPETNDPEESAASPRTAVAAWRVGSKWSLAAAYFAKGLDSSRYSEPLQQAGYAAQLLKIELPELPEISDQQSLQQETVRYLLENGGPQLVDQISEDFSTEHTALAELAIKTHALLLVYTPSNKELEPLVMAIDSAAVNSGLPETIWRSLSDLLQQRADFASVKQAVFDLHNQAAEFLAEAVGQ